MATRKTHEQSVKKNRSSPSTRLISNFLQQNAETLTATLRMYVVKAGLTKGADIQDIAAEILHETAVEALRAAPKFDSSRQPRAWLLGIAANIIKRKQVKRAVTRKNEVAVQDVLPGHIESTSISHLSDDDVFDRLVAIANEKKSQISALGSISLTVRDVASEYEANNAAERMLARCSKEDQTILRLAIIEELDGDTVAERLSVSPGTARVRLHRAIKRLHEIMGAEE